MNAVYEKLEYNKILKIISEFAVSDVVVSEILDNSAPTNDLSDAELLLLRTAEAMSVLKSSRPNLAFDDISQIIAKAKVGALLSPSELLKVKRSISALRSLKKCVETADECDSLKDITAYARVCGELELEIERTVDTDTELKDGASDKLFSLRRAITRANAKLKERLDALTHNSEISKYLQDNIITVRDGRYVVPVKAEYRSAVKGLVHDISSTGATAFIEPFAIVEANNALKTLKTEEQIEIERILTELGNKVAHEASALAEGQRVLTECGVIFAKAEYAAKIDAYSPHLNDVGIISLKGARHPLIAPQSVVPVDITLKDKRILLISGPNTGGKTVALKTVGLFAMMAASGIFLPTDGEAEMCVFDNIYCDIGDEQSIMQSLSTFSAHMTNISSIMSVIDDKALVLLDEPGDGTDPDEGAALAVAIIKKIIRSCASAVLTTHFNSVKEFALKCDDVEIACMQFDTVNYRPTFKLLQGVSGSSYALEIAAKLGMDKEIIDDARSELPKEKVALETTLREAERLRNDVLAERESAVKAADSARADALTAAKLKTEYENKLNDIKSNTHEIIRRRADEYSAHADALIEQLKEQLKRGDEQALFEARKTAAQLSDGVPKTSTKPLPATAPVDPSKLKSGVSVHIAGFEKDGVVVGKPRGDKVLVAIGQIKTEIPIASLSLIAADKKHTRPTETSGRTEPENREIIMLGMTVDEAVELLDRALTDIPPHSTLRIVHGKGTGALGRGIQAYLKKQPRIKSFRYGGYGEGDSGVTIAEVK